MSHNERIGRARFYIPRRALLPRGGSPFIRTTRETVRIYGKGVVLVTPRWLPGEGGFSFRMFACSWSEQPGLLGF